MAMTVIERARRCVATRPPAIQGSDGSATTFGVACVLVQGFGLSPEESIGLMQEYNQRCEPQWSDSELWHKLRDAEHAIGDQPRGYLLDGKTVVKGELSYVPPRPRQRRAKFDLEKLKAVQESALAMNLPQWTNWLRSKSPIDPRQVTPEAFIDALFEPNERVMIFMDMRSRGDYMRWVGRGTYRLAKAPGEKAVPAQLPEGSPEGMNFLMQPVDGRWLPKPGSVEMSRRTKDNVTRWPYLLLESDKAPHELWLNALVRAQIRIVAIVASAGRSLHAVVRLDKLTEDQWKEEVHDENARPVMEVLGSDGQAMHAMVYPRLPGTWREGKRVTKIGPDGKAVTDRGKPVYKFQPFPDGRRKQRLMYFNPAPRKGQAIAEGVTFEHP